MDAGGLVATAIEGAHENVVLVGGDHQPLDRQAHALGGVAGEDVAEIAGRHGEGDGPLRRAEAGGGGEVIDDLGHDPAPVDRVHARQRRLLAEGGVIEHRLHQRLAVVEGAVDGDRMDVVCPRGRHLALLHRRDAAMREQDEHVGALAGGEGRDGGAARVARGGADDGGAAAALGEDMVHQPGDELHRHVLEGQGRAVEELQHEVRRAELDEGRDSRMREGRIGLVDHALQIVRGDVVADIGQQDLEGDFGIGPAGESADRFRRDLRPGLREIQPAVIRETCQKCVGKTEDRSLSPRTHISHFVSTSLRTGIAPGILFGRERTVCRSALRHVPLSVA